KRDQSNKDPTTKKWLSSVVFQFRDASGQTVKMTPSQVLDTTAAPLSYSYEDTSDPLVAVVPHWLAAARVTATKKKPPEMVGATERPFHLEDSTANVAFSAHPAAAARPAKGLRAETAKPRRAFLNVENLQSSGRAPAYDVYLNVPEGADPRKYEH